MAHVALGLFGGLAGCHAGPTDDCPRPRADRVAVYPEDGSEDVPTDIKVRVLGEQQAALFSAGAQAGAVPIDTVEVPTTSGTVTELVPWTDLEADAPYEVRVGDDVLASFRTSGFSLGRTASSSDGPPSLQATAPQDGPCCGDSCRGGGAVEFPWKGPTSPSELVLVDIDEEVNGSCGATTRSVATLALAWPGDGDGTLAAAIDVPLAGCYLLTKRGATRSEGELSLGEACTEGQSFEPAPRPDSEACRGGGCGAAPSGSRGGVWVCLLALWLGLARMFHHVQAASADARASSARPGNWPP